MNEEHRINIMEDAVAGQPQTETEEQTQEPVVAGVLERFVALLIDIGLILFLYQIFLFFLLRSVRLNLSQLYCLAAGVFIPFAFYMTVFSCGGRSTLGKKLVGINVVNKYTGEPLGFFRSLVRACGYLVSGILLMCGFLLAFIDDKHQALHDYLAGSLVIQTRDKSWFEKMVLSLVGLLFLIVFGAYFYKQLFGAGSFSQQILVLKAKKHVEKIGYLEEAHRITYGNYTNDLLRLSILSGDPVQFQRDTQAVLDRKDFRIGVGPTGYKVKARAKDKKRTPVYYPDF